MKSVYGEECPSYATVVRWKRNFQTGHMSLTDEPRSGRPSVTDEVATVKKVEDLILADRRVTIQTIIQETGLSSGSVRKIIHEELHMSKVSARWVPRLLTPLQREMRRDLSRQNLTLLEQDEDNFFGRLVTMDECWVYLYDPETKEMSKEWKHSKSPPPKKAKVQKSAGKVMLSVFWDCRGVILTEYPEEVVPSLVHTTVPFWRSCEVLSRKNAEECSPKASASSPTMHPLIHLKLQVRKQRDVGTRSCRIRRIRPTWHQVTSSCSQR